MMCQKCSTMSGWLLLVFGVLFLLQNLGIWMFWGIQWWTIAFLFFGFKKVCSGSCKECQAMMKKK